MTTPIPPARYPTQNDIDVDFDDVDAGLDFYPGDERNAQRDPPNHPATTGPARTTADHPRQLRW